MKICYDGGMEGDHQITPPKGEDDVQGAQRVFEDFFVTYQPSLMLAEYHLEQIMERMESSYAEAYQPWHKALHDLLRGVYFMAKKIPLPDPAAFLDAIKIFSFDSAIHFLHDVCVNCKIELQRDWEKRFREHIDLLLFSVSIINRQQQHSPAR